MHLWHGISWKLHVGMLKLADTFEPLPLWLHLSQQHDTELTCMFMCNFSQTQFGAIANATADFWV